MTLGEDGCVMLERCPNGEFLSISLFAKLHDYFLCLPFLNIKINYDISFLFQITSEVPESEETDIDELHESLKQSTDFTSVLPVCNSSVNNNLRCIFIASFTYIFLWKYLIYISFSKNKKSLYFSCHFQMVTRLKGNVTGRLYIVTAEKIPSSELMDTTGAGDAFTGGLLYGNNKLSVMPNALNRI